MSGAFDLRLLEREDTGLCPDRAMPGVSGPGGGEGSARAQFSRPVRLALAYMNDNLAAPITLEHLARVTHCGRAQIIRAFRREVGITPHAWLIRRRVLQAKVLIEHGEPIATAAMESGFYDQTHFTRHFKRLHGETPARYRSAAWRHGGQRGPIAQDGAGDR